MFDLTHLFAGASWAADTASTAQPQGDITASIMRFMPLLLIFAVFYFLLIRPQQKKLDEHTSMTKALKKGDQVVTSGGIVGAITKLEDDVYAVIEIAQGVQVKVVRSTISSLAGSKDAAKASQTTGNKN